MIKFQQYSISDWQLDCIYGITINKNGDIIKNYIRVVLDNNTQFEYYLKVKHQIYNKKWWVSIPYIFNTEYIKICKKPINHNSAKEAKDHIDYFIHKLEKLYVLL